MTTNDIAQLSDNDLIEATARAAGTERRATAELIRLLLEVDNRRLYLSRGYPSMFAYCTDALGFSEQSAYKRIAAARACRRIPSLIDELDSGGLTLSSISVLAPHLEDENSGAIIEAARCKGTREIERMIATLYPQPDVEATVRQLPHPKETNSVPVPAPGSGEGTTARSLLSRTTDTAEEASAVLPAASAGAAPSRAVVAPLSPGRYLLRLTISHATHEKLRRLKDLMRHSIPTGDPAEIIDRALALLLSQVERQKFSSTTRHRAEPERQSKSSSRAIPATVKRAVWKRDGGRCAFVGVDGHCKATAFLEFHHVIPFARGGAATRDNIQLRCRAHNAHEASISFAWDRPHTDGVRS